MFIYTSGNMHLVHLFMTHRFVQLAWKYYENINWKSDIRGSRNIFVSGGGAGGYLSLPGVGGGGPRHILGNFTLYPDPLPTLDPHINECYKFVSSKTWTSLRYSVWVISIICVHIWCRGWNHWHAKDFHYFLLTCCHNS